LERFLSRNNFFCIFLSARNGSCIFIAKYAPGSVIFPETIPLPAH
jgi:hypothetical protein